MAYNPVSGAAIQYVTSNGEVASGYYLKFYIANTTTPLSMATDSTGGTTLVKCKLNDKGYPISNPLDNSTVFIPHVDQSYRFVLYVNETDADNNTTANADVNIPSLAAMLGGDSLTTSETDTTGILRAEDAYHADSINYHDTNLNQFEFGGLATNDFIAAGEATGATSAAFFLPISLFAAPASITNTSTFKVSNAAGTVTYGTGITLGLSGASTNKLAYVSTSAASGMTTGQNVYLRQETASSKITVNP